MKKRANKPRGKDTRPKHEPVAGGKSSQPPAKTSPVVSGPSPENTVPAFPIVGVGASAGGLEAFTQLLKHLPVDTGMGFVLVQHLDPEHESALVQLLTRATAMPVREVTHNQRVDPNHVHVIPPNTNLAIARGVLKLQPRQAGRAPPHSIDFFFESLAHDQRELAVGVILPMESYQHLQPPHAEIMLEGSFPRVMANEAGLTQCISNLLGNAVKFVAPGVTPRVRVWAEARDDRVRLCFEDNGIGIEPEAHGKIFEIFVRLSKSYEGTGIGLAIVRKAVERMGGRVGFESKPGKGSTFWLELTPATPETA